MAVLAHQRLIPGMQLVYFYQLYPVALRVFSEDPSLLRKAVTRISSARRKFLAASACV